MKLEVKNISYGPREATLGRKLNFSLSGGELLHLKGSNGSGKSFLARTILGLAPVKSGEINLQMNASRYLPQMQNRSAHLPYSLGEVLHLEGHSPALGGLLRENHLRLAWNKASGGERQRVLLARFFALPGDFLVLDEPFNHLDAGSKEKVQALIRKSLTPQTAILLISHDDEPTRWLPGKPVITLDLDAHKENNL